MNLPFEPEFTISVQAADSLVKIVENVMCLDLGTDYRLDIRLHRENRVRSIYSSLAIEGNRLSFPEVADVLQGKPVWGRPRDIQEVRNAHEAYERLPTFDPFQVDDFLAAHLLLTQDLIGEADRFRSGDVAVYSDDVPVHIGARPQFVPDLVDELFDWAHGSALADSDPFPMERGIRVFAHGVGDLRKSPSVLRSAEHISAHKQRDGIY